MKIISLILAISLVILNQAAQWFGQFTQRWIDWKCRPALTEEIDKGINPDESFPDNDDWEKGIGESAFELPEIEV